MYQFIPHDNHITQNFKKLPSYVTTLIDKDEYDTKWAVFINKLRKKQETRFMNYLPGVLPRPQGTWVVLEDDHEKNKPKVWSIRYRESMIPVCHLKVFEQFLNLYFENPDSLCNVKTHPILEYTMDYNKTVQPQENNACKDNSEEQKEVSCPPIVFAIDDQEYALTWWNQEPNFKPTAFSFVNLTEYRAKMNTYCATIRQNMVDGSEVPAKFPPTPLEISYVRWIPKIGAKWQWYDNDHSNYKDFSQTPNGIEELEVSFIGALECCFPRTRFEEQFAFVTLPQLTKEIQANFGQPKHKEYTFRVTLQNDVPVNTILNMEQICHDFEERTSFPRNIKRFLHGKSTVSLIERNKCLF